MTNGMTNGVVGLRVEPQYIIATGQNELEMSGQT